MAFKEYGNYDAVGLADLVRKKYVTARELLDEAIMRTGNVDPQINAVVVKHHDYAQRQIDRGLPDGPFTGVPFLLKDLEFLEGTRTTSGASIHKDDIAAFAGVERLPGITSFELLARRIVFEIRGQQIRMPRGHCPEQR